MLYLSYINLTPGLENEFSTPSHHAIVNVLREHFNDWNGFFDKYPDYHIGLIVATKEGVGNVDIKGPTISKKIKRVDYSIFIPENTKNMKMYLDNFFNGLNIILENYNTKATEAFKKDIQSIYKTLSF